jgi:hypothetical protein
MSPQEDTLENKSKPFRATKYTTWEKFAGYKNLPEILVLLGSILLCTRFPEYLPTTADDYSSLFTGWKNGWAGQNRLSWIITEPITLLVNRTIFSVRWTGGAHVAFFLAPTLAIYWILRKQGLLKEARLGACATLAIQVFGYDHTTPLAYPVGFSTANAISIYSGFELGAVLACQNKKAKKTLRAGIYIITGSIAGLWYEYFPLLFLITSLWGFLANRNSLNGMKLSAKAHANPKDMIKVLILAAAPIITTLGLKAAGWIIGRNTLGFNSYQGNSIPLASLSLEYLITTARISLETLFNATIVGNSDTLLSWPEEPYAISLSWITLSYCVLLSAAAFITLTSNNKALKNQQEWKDKKKQFITLAALMSMTAVQLVFNSLTTRHHSWFASWQSRTYLNASMAVTTAAFALAVATILIASWANSHKIRFFRQAGSRISIIIITCTVGYSSIATISHNLAIAGIIHQKANMLEDIITTCQSKQMSQTKRLFKSDPELAEIPISIHENELEKGDGRFLNTYCRNANTNPSLFKNWGNSNISQEEMSALVNYGAIRPSAKDFLRKHVLPAQLEQSDNQQVFWAWMTGPYTNVLPYNKYIQTSMDWSAKVVPSGNYSELLGVVSNPRLLGSRKVSIYTKGAPLNELMGEGDILMITSAITASKLTGEHFSPLPLSDDDPRRAFYRIEFTRSI